MALIDIGSRKQLLFDDHVIESLTYAKQGMNRAIKADDNPVVRSDRPWEGTHMRPLCTVFDEEAGLFKMWYRSSNNTVRVENGVPVLGGPDGMVVDERDKRICFATSKDGFDWDKPELGLVEFDGSTRNNILPLAEESLDAPGSPSFLDTHDPDPARRYKGMVRVGDTTSQGMRYHLYHSPDGISWTPDPANPVIDTTPELGRWQGRFMGWDPIRETYHVTMECSHHWRAPLGKRLIGRAESPDMVHWSEPELILAPDDEDFPDTEFYSMPLIAYEGVYVGMPWIFRTTNTTHHPELAFSRDGARFRRDYREPFIPFGGAAVDFDSNNIHVQDIIVHGDRVLIYYLGENWRAPQTYFDVGADRATGGIGLATCRLDGFVSVDGGNGWVPHMGLDDDLLGISGKDYLFERSVGPDSFSQMATRTFSFAGSGLYLNETITPLAAGPGPGEIRVEVLKSNYKRLPGFTFDDCDPIANSGLARRVTWNGNGDLGSLAGRPVKLRFYFKNAKLYSFQFK